MDELDALDTIIDEAIALSVELAADLAELTAELPERTGPGSLLPGPRRSRHWYPLRPFLHAPVAVRRGRGPWRLRPREQDAPAQPVVLSGELV
jgi:hypothetical protein